MSLEYQGKTMACPDYVLIFRFWPLDSEFSSRKFLVLDIDRETGLFALRGGVLRGSVLLLCPVQDGSELGIFHFCVFKENRSVSLEPGTCWA